MIFFGYIFESWLQHPRYTPGQKFTLDSVLKTKNGNDVLGFFSQKEVKFLPSWVW